MHLDARQAVGRECATAGPRAGPGRRCGPPARYQAAPRERLVWKRPRDAERARPTGAPDRATRSERSGDEVPAHERDCQASPLRGRIRAAAPHRLARRMKRAAVGTRARVRSDTRAPHGSGWMGRAMTMSQRPHGARRRVPLRSHRHDMNRQPSLPGTRTPARRPARFPMSCETWGVETQRWTGTCGPPRLDHERGCEQRHSASWTLQMRVRDIPESRKSRDSGAAPLASLAVKRRHRPASTPPPSRPRRRFPSDECTTPDQPAPALGRAP